jgi:hypothetical protein
MKEYLVREYADKVMDYDKFLEQDDDTKRELLITWRQNLTNSKIKNHWDMAEYKYYALLRKLGISYERPKKEKAETAAVIVPETAAVEPTVIKNQTDLFFSIDLEADSEKITKRLSALIAMLEDEEGTIKLSVRLSKL